MVDGEGVRAIKQTAYIFGAGMAGQRAYENLQQDYHVLGFIDNDERKQGSSLCGITIHAPEAIYAQPSDKIFIASEFFEQIQRQLTRSLKINPNQLSPLPARMLAAKRFEHDEVSIRQSLQLLDICCQLLHRIAVTHHIDAGTLLGLYRDKTLIPWDDDLDIAIDATGVSVVQANLHRFQEALSDVSGERWRVDTCYSDSAFGNVPAKAIRAFKFVSEAEKPLPSIDFFVKYRSDEFSDYCLASRGIRMPARYTDSIAKLASAGYEWPIPQDTEGYLTYHYGNWQVPDPNWCLQDLNNTEVF